MGPAACPRQRIPASKNKVACSSSDHDYPRRSPAPDRSHVVGPCDASAGGHAKPECNYLTRGVTVRMPDGERWTCKYDPEFNDYFWEPIEPDINDDPLGGVSWNTAGNTWTASDGVTHRATSRVEFITDTLYTGADTFVRNPQTSRLTLPAGDIAVYSDLYAWNGVSWSRCRSSGWAYSTSSSHFLARTFSWGLAPCGYVWYASVDFVAHRDAASAQWLVSPARNSSGPGTQTAGVGGYLGVVNGGQCGIHRPRVARMPAFHHHPIRPVAA